MRRAVVVVAGVLVAVAFAVPYLAARAAGGTDRLVVAIDSPTEAIVTAVANRPDLDVRWVESGLVLFECAPETAWPPAWNGRVVAHRAGDRELGILRAPEIPRWSKPGTPLAEFLAKARVAQLAPASGPLWVLEAHAATWPVELLGCHGGLVLPPHGCDPRSLVDAGPPAALRPYMRSPGAALGAGPLRVVAAVSADSLRANVERLALDAIGSPADRFVFHPDLDGFYAERVLAAMQRAVAGIADATVGRQAFPMRRSLADTIDTFQASNLVAHVPGSVPGLGTWVVGAHVDATGSRNSGWVGAIQAGTPVETPGAEDNATGVACVLELLRCAADGIRAGDLEFPFDVDFVAFSGEEVPVSPSPEQGLVGSQQYIVAAAGGPPLLGCLNFDMVGYDSIPGNLQVAFNHASRWLADWVAGAAAELVPASPLQLQVQLDEGRRSDHNNFWNANVSAVIAADADIDHQRNYQSYHQPIDRIERVDVDKLTEVARVILAALVRFDMRGATVPQLAFDPQDLRIWRTVEGHDYEYDPGYHALFPGAPMYATLAVHSTGARYMRPLHVQVETRGSNGADPFYDVRTPVDLPAGGSYVLRVGIPVRPGDLGWRHLVARVTYDDSLAGDVVQTQIDSFFVDVDRQSPLAVTIAPNPVRGALDTAKLVFALEVAGDLAVDVYNMEGQRVASSTRSVQPDIKSQLSQFRLTFMPAGAAGAQTGTSLASGAYVARVVLRSTTGQTFTAHVPFALLR